MSLPWQRDIHKFQMKGERFLVDANSGAVYQIDQIVWDYFVLLEQYDKKKAREKLLEVHQHQQVEESLGELAELESQGWLFSSDQDTRAKAEKLEPGVLKSLCLHVAHDCNLRCQYCFASTGDYKGKRGMMTKEVGLAAVDFLLRQSPEVENYILDFFGGEPLLNFPVVKAVIEYAEEKSKILAKKFKFSLTTNATLLNAEIGEYLNQHDVEVIISLDGSPEVHDAMRPFPNGKGSQQTVLAKAKEFLQARNKYNYYIRGTFTGLHPHFAENVEYLADQGFGNISLEPVITLPEDSYALTEEHLPILEAEYEKLVHIYLERKKSSNPLAFFHFETDIRKGPCLSRRIMGCGAGTEYLSIGPQGEIYPCHQFMGRDGYLMGSILEGNYSPSIGISLQENHIYKKKCADCWARFYCSGGCHANAHLINGDISVPYELNCALEKKRLECAFYLQAKLEDC